MLIHSGALSKTIILPHKTKVEIIHKSNPTKPSTIIVENTKNLPNSSSYTLEYKIVRKSHILSQNWHFLKCHGNCSTNKRKLLTHKAAIDCSYIYCEGKYDKVSQTHTFSLQMHYCVHWV